MDADADANADADADAVVTAIALPVLRYRRAKKEMYTYSNLLGFRLFNKPKVMKIDEYANELSCTLVYKY